MNIFFLDEDPQLCAIYHCDKHVVKMCVEYAQLLSTAHHLRDDVGTLDGIYRPTHVKHPCAKWTIETRGNYIWLYRLWLYLLDEYTHRYAREHKSGELRGALLNVPRGIPKGERTEPPQAMPLTCQDIDPVMAYRVYYVNEKARMLTWRNRSKPAWLFEPNYGR